MSQRSSSGVWVWVWRLWVTGAVQEVVEVWIKTWLVGKFRSPHLCRVSVAAGQWCMVPSLTQASGRRVPAWMCQYDPWCGDMVYLETTPPLVTRFTVLFTALLLSLLVVWAPRLLTYRPSQSLLVWLRRHTPRRMLVLVGVSATFQLTLDHCLFALLLPPHLLLSRVASLLSFTIAQLLISVALVRQVRRPPQPLHTRPHVPLHHSAAKPPASEVATMPQEPREDTLVSRARTAHHLPQTA